MDSRYSGWRTVAGSIVVLGAVSGWASANPTMYHTWHADLPNVIAEEEGKVEEDPNNVGKVPFLAEVYIEAERFEDAERELDRVSVLPGVEPGAVKRLRGEIMLASGDTEGGRAMIWAAAEECTRARDARRIWRRVGDIEEYYLNPYSAAEAYERAAGIALGVSEGRYGSQDMISRAAMRTSGRALWLAMAASLAQRRRGEDEWRVQMLDMAEALGTDNALLYRVQALTYQDADRADEAIAAARRSPELDSEDPMTHYLLAGLLGGSGMDDESARHYEEMARTAGQFRDVAGEAHHHLAWHMQQREDFQQAYLHYEQATPTLSKKWEPALLAALAIRGNEAERASAVFANSLDEFLATGPRFPNESVLQMRGTFAEFAALGFVGEPDEIESPAGPTYTSALAEMHAALLGAAGDYDGMHQVLDKALDTELAEPDGPTPMWWEILRELRHGDPEAAALTLASQAMAGTLDLDDGAVAYLEEAVAVAPCEPQKSCRYRSTSHWETTRWYSRHSASFSGRNSS